MHVHAATAAALEHIAMRGADVAKAFTPGAAPAFDDASAVQSAHASLDRLTAAPPEGAYFVTTDGRGRTTYTKDGACALHEGVLCGENGQPVLGYAGAGAPLSALRIDAVDNALGRVGNPRIDAQGRLLYDRSAIDPRSGAAIHETVCAGTLALARFPAGTRAQSVDAAHVTLPDGVVPHYGRAGDGSFGAIAPMQRAGSTIDLDTSIARLADAYLAFDALQAASKASGKAGKTAMDLVK